MILPGGRYSCAQVLVQRCLTCLATCSLGQVCHIVQLAISQKKLLGYLNGTVVPYSRSLSMVKEQSARCQRPCSNTVRRSKHAAFATWDIMRPCLQQLLSTTNQPMPLSNVKRLFRAQFHVELSETALGYAKLSECLQDPRVRDLCDVKLQGQGYTITPAKKPVQRSLISLADSLCVEPQTLAWPHTDKSRVETSLLHKRRGPIQHLSMDVISPKSSPRAAMQPSVMPESPCVPAVSSRATPVGMAFPPTPSPHAACSQPLPRLLGRIRPQSQTTAKEVNGASVAMEKILSPAKASQRKERRGVQRSPRYSKFSPLTPSALGIMGLAVHNTFLHAPLPPPTPVRAQTRARARSLPRHGC